MAKSGNSKKSMAGAPVEFGFELGEFVYEVDLGYDAVIRVRSSVRADGWSAGNGEDSIRALITDRSGKPIGSAKSAASSGDAERASSVAKVRSMLKTVGGEWECLD